MNIRVVEIIPPLGPSESHDSHLRLPPVGLSALIVHVIGGPCFPRLGQQNNLRILDMPLVEFAGKALKGISEKMEAIAIR